jgi:glycosyltransferase involved in cell wall biosynthesis
MQENAHLTGIPVMEQRPRVVLIAYGCEPNRGSEPGTGWNMALGLAAEYDLTVVTRANNRTVIEDFLADHGGATPEFLYVDPPRWILALKKSGLLPVQMFYVIWQWAVARVLVARGPAQYDIIHQLTFNSFEVPPLAFLQSPAIKVWGPVGGGQTVPTGLLPCFGFLGGIKEGLRNLRVRLSALSPLCRKILKKSDLVLFANGETRELLQGACRARTGVMIDVGVDVDRFSTVGSDPGSGVTTVLFAGRLEGRKGVILLVHAIARLAATRDDLRLRVA